MYLDLKEHYIYKDKDYKRLEKDENGYTKKTYHKYYCSCGSVYERVQWSSETITLNGKECPGKNSNSYVYSIPITYEYIKFIEGQGEIIGHNYIRTIYIENDILKVKDELRDKNELHVSFKDRKMYVINEEGKKYTSRQNINKYTHNDPTLKMTSEEDRIITLIKSLVQYKSRTSVIGMLTSFIKNFEDEKWLQILCYADIPYSFLNHIIDSHKRGYIYSMRPDIHGKNPREILKLSKKEYEYLKTDWNRITYRRMRDGEDILFHDRVNKEARKYTDLNIICTTQIAELIKWGYDFERLIKYICYDIDRLQGIGNPTDGARLLHDTVKMHKEMKEKMYEKYPKSLKLRHDIAIRNYRIVEDAIIEEKFIEKCSQEEYKKFAYSDQSYAILCPDKPNDLVREGAEMSHCVASYIKAVSEGRSKIFFLRDKEDITKSLVTIEVVGHNVIQVKAKHNLRPSEQVINFVKKWCAEKNLDYYSW